jgi:hypothetical protein
MPNRLDVSVLVWAGADRMPGRAPHILIAEIRCCSRNLMNRFAERPFWNRRRALRGKEVTVLNGNEFDAVLTQIQLRRHRQRMVLSPRRAAAAVGPKSP